MDGTICMYQYGNNVGILIDENSENIIKKVKEKMKSDEIKTKSVKLTFLQEQSEITITKK